MLMWSALASLGASLVVLGPLAESAPSWAREAALLVTAMSAFILVCLLEGAGRGHKAD